MTDSSAQIAALVAARALSPGPGGPFRGRPGKRYKTVACALRNTGAPNYWQPIDDANHHPIGVESVTTGGGGTITLNYDFTATAAIALVASADDSLALKGVVAGASVGLDYSLINVGRPVQAVSAQLSWSGSAWTIIGTSTSVAFNQPAGRITVTHTAVADLGVSIVPRYPESGALPFDAVCGALTTTTSEIILIDRATGLPYTGSLTGGRILFSRASLPGVAGLTEFTAPTDNIWVYGVFEVA